VLGDREAKQVPRPPGPPNTSTSRVESRPGPAPFPTRTARPPARPPARLGGRQHVHQLLGAGADVRSLPARDAVHEGAGAAVRRGALHRCTAPPPLATAAAAQEPLGTIPGAPPGRVRRQGAARSRAGAPRRAARPPVQVARSGRRGRGVPLPRPRPAPPAPPAGGAPRRQRLRGDAARGVRGAAVRALCVPPRPGGRTYADPGQQGLLAGPRPGRAHLPRRPGRGARATAASEAGRPRRRAPAAQRAAAAAAAA
jgi:hypothetical protein